MDPEWFKVEARNNILKVTFSDSSTNHPKSMFQLSECHNMGLRLTIGALIIRIGFWGLLIIIIV